MNGPYARARRAGESAPSIPDEVRAPAGFSLSLELSRPDAEPERDRAVQTRMPTRQATKASAANEPTRFRHSRGEAVRAQETKGRQTRTLGAAAEPDPQGTPEGYSGWTMEGTVFSTPS